VTTRSSRVSRIVRFDSFELDLRAGELRKNGQRIRIQEQPYRLLAMLAERPGEVVLRDEIRRRLWPNDTAVEVSHGINAAVQRLREALGETAESPRFIETVTRRGYRFRSAAATPADNGRFRILEKLGGGGMGVVYRAEDLKLGRLVAIKFLPPEAAGDPIAIGRFEREARAASALNHPNICTIYGIEEIGGQSAIAMELIEGETLESVLARGPLPLANALSIATQLAAALEAAHAKGIVHRDLKPANLLVDGCRLKILDFGLAKMPGAEVTREGSVIGTPDYMSPEQLRGHTVDPRSDLYTFGLVLYELVTGHRARNTQRPSLAPAALDRILQRCLADRPNDRWQSASELKAALQTVPLDVPRAAPKFHLRPRYWIGVAAAAVLAAALLFTGRTPAEGRMRSPVPVMTHIVVPGPDGAPIARLGLSPDGRRLAFTANNSLYVQSLDEPSARPVEGGEGAGTPFWSPDSRSVAFTARGALKISHLTGPPSVIGAAHTNIAGAWNTDGTILIGGIGDGIFRMSAAGGPMERVTAPDRALGEARHLLPAFFAPVSFLFVAGGPTGGMLCAAELGSPRSKPVARVDSGVQFAAGHLLFLRNHVLVAQRFDPKRWEAVGPEFPIAGNIAAQNAIGAVVTVGEFSAAATAIAYRSTTDPGTVTIARNWTALAP